MSENFGEGLRVLVVDDEQVVITVFEHLLGGLGFEVACVDSLATAIEKIRESTFDLIVADKNLPDGSGLDVLRELSDRFADTELILVTGYASVASAVEAVKLGVADYITKPFENDDVIARVRRTVEMLRLKRTNRLLADNVRSGLATLQEISGTLSKLMESEPGLRDQLAGARDAIDQIRSRLNTEDDL